MTHPNVKLRDEELRFEKSGRYPVTCMFLRGMVYVPTYHDPERFALPGRGRNSIGLTEMMTRGAVPVVKMLWSRVPRKAPA